MLDMFEVLGLTRNSMFSKDIKAETKKRFTLDDNNEWESKGLWSGDKTKYVRNYGKRFFFFETITWEIYDIPEEFKQQALDAHEEWGDEWVTRG